MFLHGPQMRGRHPVAKRRAVRGAVDAEDVSEFDHHKIPHVETRDHSLS
jgi:hypothetical protein